MQPYIDHHETARILGISLRTLYRWRKDGSGPPFMKIGHKIIRYERADVLRFMDEKKTKKYK